MKALLDTSVLIAAFYQEHEHHKASIELLLRFKKREVCCAAHSLAEVYATLTAMPGAKRASPAEALLYLGSLKERLTWVSLDSEEYLSATELAAVSGAASGGVYDALIGQCFIKSRAELLYTWNIRHFEKLGSGIGEKVRRPTR